MFVSGANLNECKQTWEAMLDRGSTYGLLCQTAPSPIVSLQEWERVGGYKTELSESSLVHYANQR